MPRRAGAQKPRALVLLPWHNRLRRERRCELDGPWLDAIKVSRKNRNTATPKTIMKQKIHTTLMAGLLLASLAIGSAHGATLIIGDDYNVTNNGTGFNPNSGVNSGINPPTTTTRLQGTSVSGIRYVKVEGARGGNLHYITNATPGSPPGKNVHCLWRTSDLRVFHEP